MNDKVLINLYIPFIEKKYEIFIPASKKIGEIIYLIGNSLKDITNGYYTYKKTEKLYNRLTGKEYNLNEIIKHTNIKNGTELVFM